MDDYLPGMGRHWLLPLYDPLTRTGGVAAAHDRQLDAADPRPGQRVLEIGCGTGNLLLAAKRRQPAAVVTGLDPDPRALARARRKAGRARLTVELVQGYAADLPYPDGSVDLVLSALMLHHLDPAGQQAALAEVGRVLAADGELHLMDIGGPGAGPPTGRLGRWLHRRAPHPHAGGDIPAQLAAAGLTGPTVTGTATTRLGTLTLYRAGAR